MNYTESLQYCKDMGGEPFIPKTSEEFEMVQDFCKDFKRNTWLPVHDSTTEGQLQWWNGEDAMADAKELDWYDDDFMNYNDQGDHDCLVIPMSFMGDCADKLNPMVCEKKMDITDEKKNFLDEIISLGGVGTGQFLIKD